MLTPKDFVPTNPKIIELSKLLRSLPIHKVNPANDGKFRNPNGIVMILKNLRRLDTCAESGVLNHGSKLQEKVWSYYVSKRDYLHKVAAAIRNCLPLPFEFCRVPDLDERDFIEGSILYQYHRYIENDFERVQRLRNRASARGKLQCELCGFDFFMAYGDLGEDLIECHHMLEVANYKNGM